MEISGVNFQFLEKYIVSKIILDAFFDCLKIPLENSQKYLNITEKKN